MTGSTLSPRELDALSAFALSGDQRLAADAVGVSVQTVKNHLRFAYLKLGVRNAIDAFRVMGWLRVPPEPGQGEDDGSTQPVETVLVFSNSPSVTVTAP